MPLTYIGHKNRKWLHFSITVFAYIFFVFKYTDFILVPSCLSRQDASKHTHCDLERLRSKFELRSRSRGDPSRSCDTWFDASWWEKHNETTPTSLSLLNKKLLVKKRLVIAIDLRWPFEGSPMKTDTWVITNNLRLHHSEWMEMIWCRKEVVKILPIDNVGDAQDYFTYTHVPHGNTHTAIPTSWNWPYLRSRLWKIQNI